MTTETVGDGIAEMLRDAAQKLADSLGKTYPDAFRSFHGEIHDGIISNVDRMVQTDEQIAAVFRSLHNGSTLYHPSSGLDLSGDDDG